MRLKFLITLLCMFAVAGSAFSQKKIAEKVKKKEAVGKTVVATMKDSYKADVSTDSPFKTSKLSNGLEIITIENGNVPLATIAVAVRNGAFTEPEEFAGLSHLYEHMFFKANEVLSSQEEYMRRVKELGIVFNGYTSDEVVVYFFTLPTKNLEAGMKFMADALRKPLFKEEELVRERPVVLGEFDRNEAEPSFVLRYALDSAMWNPYVSRKQALGQRPVINTATVEKMREIQKKFYMPNNSALIVSGDVAQSEVESLAKKYLGDWEKGEYPFPKFSPPIFPRLKPQLVVRESKLPDVQLRMLFRGPSIIKDGDDDFAGELITTMISQGNSKFYKKFVDSGLITNGGFGYGQYMNVSPAGFYINVKAENTKKVIDMLKSEIREMSKTGYFSKEEIETAKQIIADSKMFDQDNPQNFNINVTARIWSKSSLKYYDDFSKNVARMNQADISKFVNKYLLNQAFVLGLGCDKDEAAKIGASEDMLKW